MEPVCSPSHVGIGKETFSPRRVYELSAVAAKFCDQGDIVATFSTFVDCCPPGNSCYFGTSCSESYQVQTVIGSLATKNTAKMDWCVVLMSISLVQLFAYYRF